MGFDRFLVAPLNSGLQTDLKAWQILDDSFSYLQNAYAFRGRIRKRFGTILMGSPQLQSSSRLRVSLGNNTNAAMNLPANTAAHTPQLAIGQTFTLGTDFFNVYQLGAGVATLSTNAGVSAVIDSTVNPNTITFTGGALTDVEWYPSLPVMGITQYLQAGTAVNNHPTYAFDTEFAYTFNGGAWARSGTAVWKGSNLNYFWATNWVNKLGVPALYVTNFNAHTGNANPAATDDPIWYYDGTNWVARLGSSVANGIFFLPGGAAAGAGPFVQTCRIILAFKNRLLLLNTIENNNTGGAGVGTGVATAYVNRCRFSWNGDPTAVNAWYEPNQSDAAGNVASGAGFIDAATDEQIIGAEFVKDRLIVYFERSAWEISYNGNEIEPFTWNKLNTELGSQSTFSTVAFDKAILAIGNSGIHACNGSNVERIDNKIPDEVFDSFATKNNQTARTAGIRDYFTELVYWAFVDTEATANQPFANQVLVYNYANGSWAINDDCFTTFGYFEQQVDMTWVGSAPQQWLQFNQNWIDNVDDANHRVILGGTPEGFVLIIAPGEDRNAASMQITNLSATDAGVTTLTIINHNLSEIPTQLPVDSDYIYLENIVGTASTLNGGIFKIITVPNANTVTINTTLTSASTYLGKGTAARVSNPQIYSKQFNPYAKQNRNVYLAKIDFAVEKTASGQITVDYYPSTTDLSMIQAGQASGSIMGTGVLETNPYDPIYAPLEQQQQMLWHPLYFQCTAEFIQFVMYLSDQQMLTPIIALSPFEMHAFCLYTQSTSYRME